MKKRNKIILVLAIIAWGLVYGWYRLLLSPGKLDFFLHGGTYNKIAEEILLPKYDDIFGVEKKEIYFVNKKENCYRYNEPRCDKKYDILFELLDKSNLLGFSGHGEKVSLDHMGFYGVYHEYGYFYKKDGFSEEEKREKDVKEIINDNWIVRHY